MKAIENVTAVYDFHLWSISVGKHALSAHVACEDESQAMVVLTEVSKVCKKEFKIDHITIQVEAGSYLDSK